MRYHKRHFFTSLPLLHHKQKKRFVATTSKDKHRCGAIPPWAEKAKKSAMRSLRNAQNPSTPSQNKIKKGCVFRFPFCNKIKTFCWNLLYRLRCVQFPAYRIHERKRNDYLRVDINKSYFGSRCLENHWKAGSTSAGWKYVFRFRFSRSPAGQQTSGVTRATNRPTDTVQSVALLGRRPPCWWRYCPVTTSDQ